MLKRVTQTANSEKFFCAPECLNLVSNRLPDFEFLAGPVPKQEEKR